eukprot:CAMPEP_0204377556 /NCGR_PEP_ID=MMETSP0469-20131031/51038_1 /ASSEMBLY_ACC=CAM_ASM_000384 /TAXON_ID=2969 /ORGANISM="Oxyrrhis marina" /LENGTH=71 /DNA_ID=CAMNT_0051368659 /DNA_START=90 /DNA_END=302 /DNA_ORIENTATION=-
MDLDHFWLHITPPLSSCPHEISSNRNVVRRKHGTRQPTVLLQHLQLQPGQHPLQLQLRAREHMVDTAPGGV